MATTTTVKLADLVRDERLRLRVDGFNVGDYAESSVVQRYADDMGEYSGWGEFPPVQVVRLTAEHVFTDPTVPKGQKKKYPVGSLLLVGGFTRTAAALKQGVKEAPAEIIEGTWEDAERIAFRENSVHGRPRSTAERHLVYRRIIAAHPGQELSHREIAAIARTNKNDVWRFMKSQEQGDNPTPVVAPVDADDPGEAMTMRTPGAGNRCSVVVRCDMWGRPLPDNKRLAAQFEAVPEILSHAQRIRASIHKLAQKKHGPEGKESCECEALRYIDVTDIYATIETQVDQLTAGIPFIVCPSCDGVECETCNHKGYLTRLEADDLPPNLEKRARKWMGDRKTHQ